MTEARNLRKQYLEFLSLTRSSSSSSSSKRWGPLEFALIEQLEAIKKKIDEALRHDFDTPEVLRLLQHLVSYGYVYMQEKRSRGDGDGGHDPVGEALDLVADCVEDMLSMFGLTSVRNRGLGGDGDKGKVSESIIDTCSSVLYCL